MIPTTSYGNWCNRVAPYNTSVESSVADAISGGDSDWHKRMEAAGAIDAIEADYRRAIDVALPDGLSLCGDEFYGPADGDLGDLSGYPQTDDGGLDIRAIVEGIDLGAIVERHDVDYASERGCQGHTDDDFALTSGKGIGEAVYCDGSCNPS